MTSAIEPVRDTVTWKLGFARVTAALVANLVLAFSSAAQVQGAPGPRSSPHGMTWGELALLPEYCPDAQGVLYGDQYYNTSPRAARWVAKMGQGFWAIHHYCRALLYISRAEAAGTSLQVRRHLYDRATKDYIYTLEHSAPDMVLVPEILVRLGEAYLKLGNLSEAQATFDRARRTKPDYWPAYSRWVDVLIKLGLNSEARELAAEGLRHSPDAEALQEQYRSLGGDPTKIASTDVPSPREKSAAPPASASASQ